MFYSSARLTRTFAAALVIATFGSPAVRANAPADATPAVDRVLSRADLAVYHGWIKYLKQLADTAAAKHGATSADAKTQLARLADWTTRIEANPHLLTTLTGAQEWAYESPVDGSGQPFKLAIPDDYDPKKPAALSVYLHGYSGNHLEHATGLAAGPGLFRVSVLGRSRGGGYRALSEADVLHVIDYIQAHWSIDPARIHINGGSMGGWGTYQLGSRYPHRWASGRPTCGYASFVPVANLLTLPIYATHSADDWVVSVLHARGPLARLRALGGQAILDETDGLGHAAWNYAEGNARGDAWIQPLVRPDSRTVRHIDYTALDGGAMRGWWAEIVEWGDTPAPARFVLTAGANNSLHAELTNVARLRLRLAESPLDRARSLTLSVNGGVPLTLAAPLPDTIVLSRDGARWQFESTASALPFRLHTPGSATLLYQGEPLLIVYGTSGSESLQAAMRSAATAASKSPNPVWPDDGGELAPDGVPQIQNLYGHLNVKADRDVTDADIARCHLVLIGTATQNSLVARLASKLPVTFSAGEIACSDGVTFRAPDQALGLVHYNPLAPQRLVFWVASDNPAVYAPRSWIPQWIGGGVFLTSTPSAVDLIVADAARPTLIAARSFDSRWQWHPARAVSPVLPAALQSERALEGAIAGCVRQLAGAHFALAPRPAATPAPVFATGLTRRSDLAARYTYSPIGVLTLNGAELKALAAKLAAAGSPVELHGATADSLAAVEVDADYRLALPADLIWALAGFAHQAPARYEHTDLTVGTAIERFLLAP